MPQSQVWHQVWSLSPHLNLLGRVVLCDVESGGCVLQSLWMGGLSLVFSPTQGQACGDIGGPECVVEWGVEASALLRDLNNTTVEGA